MYATGVPANVTSTNPIIFPTIVSDTHGAYNSTSGRYTIPIPGWYAVSTRWEGTQVTGTAGILYKNAVLYQKIGGTPQANYYCLGSGTFYFIAGDIIDIRTDANVTSFAAANSNFLSINRLSGPALIANSESVNARYYASSTSLSGSLATIVWTTKDFDTHLGMASGIYTVPVAGKYHVAAALAVSGTLILNNTSIIEIQKNNTAVSNLTRYAGGAITQDGIDIEDVISCIAGDTIRIQVSNSGTGPAIVSSNTRNFISIARLGN